MFGRHLGACLSGRAFEEPRDAAVCAAAFKGTEGTAERDYLAHGFRIVTRKFACVDASERLTYKGYGLSVRVSELAHVMEHAFEQIVTWAEIAAERPGVSGVVKTRKPAAKKSGRLI